MTLREKQRQALVEARAIIEKARTEQRNLTAAEHETLAAKQAEIADLAAKAAQADADAGLIGALDGSRKGALVEGVSDVSLSFKGVADRILNREGSAQNVKALIAAGSQTVETTDTGLLVVKERPAESVLDLVPAAEVTPNFSYLRQTVRTNNAAPVARGGLKPTSVFTLERVESRLKVVAHISEPIHEYDLKDLPALRTFVQQELLGGLADAVLEQFLFGDGIGENLAGVTLASGIQTQAWSTDKIETARYGLGKLESLGMTGGFYALHPTDWLAIELTRATPSGTFLMATNGSPVESVRRRMWGLPVALSTAITPGVGYAVAEEAVELFHDGTIEVAWGYASGGFEHNQVVARCEGRFEAGALRPSGIVEMDLTAA